MILVPCPFSSTELRVLTRSFVVVSLVFIFPVRHFKSVVYYWHRLAAASFCYNYTGASVQWSYLSFKVCAPVVL